MRYGFLVNLEFVIKYFLFKDEVNSSQRNHASSWLRKVAASMHFGIDTYALSVDLVDRFLATLKVCLSFEIFRKKSY
jgi:NADH:ubiquinone oxidoreductase subunit 4 (subunit M)